MSIPLAQNDKFNKEDGAEKVDEGLYRSIIGCLMYLTATRPDIMYFVSLLSRYMHCASELHYKAPKRVLRYIKGTLEFGMKFEKEATGFCMVLQIVIGQDHVKIWGAQLAIYLALNQVASVGVQISRKS